MGQEPLNESLESFVRAEAAFHLAAIVDSSEDAIVSKDLDGTIRSWNQGAERLFGFGAHEVVGRSIRLIIPADRQAEEDEVLRRIRRGDRVDHFETVRQRKDGSLVDISLTVSPVRNDDSAIIGASKIARDISKQKAAESALRSALEAKDHFLSMVSHELRTPISIILGNGQLLLRRRDALSAEEEHQSLVDIATHAERLHRTIDNLLALTRAESGEAPEMDSLDVGEIAARSVELFRQRDPEREIRHRREPAGRALGNSTAVTLVVENLISNALKYSPGENAVDVVTGTDESGRPCVEVLDRGIGVDAGEVSELFAPFYRSSSATRVANGMGLGLAVCRKLVEAQGGEIWGGPRPDGGSIFGFALARSDG